MKLIFLRTNTDKPLRKTLRSYLLRTTSLWGPTQINLWGNLWGVVCWGPHLYEDQHRWTSEENFEELFVEDHTHLTHIRTVRTLDISVMEVVLGHVSYADPLTSLQTLVTHSVYIQHQTSSITALKLKDTLPFL